MNNYPPNFESQLEYCDVLKGLEVVLLIAFTIPRLLNF
jgi:hypothetical protein